MTDTAGEGPYARAAYIPKLQQTGIMAFLDLDRTLTNGGDGDPPEQEVADRAMVRQILDSQDAVVGAVTARTCSLTLSSAQYNESPELRRLEPRPRWGIDPTTRKHVYVPIETVPYFAHCIDFDFTASFGGYVIVKNGSGYKVDHDYARQLRFDHAKRKDREGNEIANPDPWQLLMLQFVVDKLTRFAPYMSKLAARRNYETGVTNVAPLEFRYQFEFVGSEGYRLMQELQQVIELERMASNPAAVSIATVDESRPNDADPEQSRYTLYLVPWNARKEKMIHRVFSQSAKVAGRKTKDCRLFGAGDSPTDLRAGLWAGGDADFKFVIPCHSPLAPYLIERRENYGSQSLSFLWGNPTKSGRPKDLLVATNQKGVYHFVHKARGPRRNTIVIADERYSGCTAPGSVAEFLEEFLVNNGAGH